MLWLRPPLLITMTLLLTPLSIADLRQTSSQTPNGWNSIDQDMGFSSALNDSNGQGQDGIVRTTAKAVWGTLRHYVVGEDDDDFAGRVASLKDRLLREVEDEVSVYTSVAAYTWPDDHSRPGNRTVAAVSASDDDDDGGGGRDDDLQRSKRDHPVDHSLIRDPQGVALLERVKQLKQLVSLGRQPMLGVQMTLWHGRLIVAAIDIRKSVNLYAITGQTYKVDASPPFPGVHSCGFTLVPNDCLLVACISPNRSTVLHDAHREAAHEVIVYQVEEEAYGSGVLSIKFRQSIEVDHPVDVEMWNQGSETYLLIANSKVMVEVLSPSREVTTNKTSYHTSSSLYLWREYYFDALQQRVLPGTNPSSVTNFSVGSRHFVAMANFRNNKGQHNTDSFIFHYSLEEKHFVLFQRLPTRGARHMASFTLGYHHLAGTFLAVANNCQDEDDGACSPYTNSAIYRYTSKKFVLFQEVATVSAVQWLAVQVKGTVLLAVVQMTAGVTFFQYDGWRFVAVSLQHYEGAIGPRVTGLAATHWNGTVVLAVSSLEAQNSLFQPLDFFELSFRNNTWLKKVHREYRVWCLAALQEAMPRGLITSLVQQFQAASNQTYTFNHHTTIQGDLTAGLPSSVTQVFERTTSRQLPVVASNITQMLLLLEREVEQVVEKIYSAVSLVSPVTWPGGLHLAHLSAGSASAQHMEAHQVNRRIVSWKNAVMLKGTGTLHLSWLRVAHVEIQAAARVSRLTGRTFSSFVTLTGHLTIHGHVSFTATVHAVGLVANTVDGLMISRESVLVTDGSQYVKGSVTCHHLNVTTLKVITINDVSLSPLLSTLVLKDGHRTVGGLVRVMGNLAYYGNLRVNLSTPLDQFNALKTDHTGLQVITNDHQMDGLVTQALAVEGRLNAVRVPADVFLNGSQQSYTLASAAFTHLRATFLFVSHEFHKISRAG